MFWGYCGSVWLLNSKTLSRWTCGQSGHIHLPLICFYQYFSQFSCLYFIQCLFLFLFYYTHSFVAAALDSQSCYTGSVCYGFSRPQGVAVVLPTAGLTLIVIDCGQSQFSPFLFLYSMYPVHFICLCTNIHKRFSQLESIHLYSYVRISNPPTSEIISFLH